MRGGRRFAGRFVIEGPAGAGAMGAVYRARDADGTSVALKVLHELDPAGLARFEREVRTLSNLCHRHIVRHIAHGLEGRAPWLAMEWLRGISLRRRLKAGPLAPAAVVQLGRGLALALDHAHRQLLIHRDLKPSNVILVRADPRDVRLIDFGVVRDVAATRLTETGALVGSPGYVAPEQARGSSRIDGRADLFALGCLLYRAVSGREAFPGGGLADRLLNLLYVPPLPLGDPVPPELWALIRCLLAKEPDDRPSTGREVADELDALGAELPTVERDAGSRLRAVAVVGRSVVGATDMGRTVPLGDATVFQPPVLPPRDLRGLAQTVLVDPPADPLAVLGSVSVLVDGSTLVWIRGADLLPRVHEAVAIMRRRGWTIALAGSESDAPQQPLVVGQALATLGEPGRVVVDDLVRRALGRDLGEG